AKQAALAAASCQSGSYLGRFIVVVDDDIDPTNLFEVLWAMCTRCDPAEDIDIIRKMWSGPLDPRIPRGVSWNSRAVTDACCPFDGTLRPEQGRDAAARHGLAEQVALHLGAAREPQEVRLIFGIDTLGDDLQPQRPGERDHGRDERHGVGFLEHRNDEGAVDL